MEVFKDSKTVRNGAEWMHRLFLSATLTVVVAVIIALISGCSIYKSNGRKTFEERAPDNLATTVTGQSVSNRALTAESDTCWTQPKKDPLWDIQENEQLNVHVLNSELIEVCLATEN